MDRTRYTPTESEKEQQSKFLHAVLQRDFDIMASQLLKANADSYFEQLERRMAGADTDRAGTIIVNLLGMAREVVSRRLQNMGGEWATIQAVTVEIVRRLQSMAKAELAALAIPSEPRLAAGLVALGKAPLDLTEADLAALRGLLEYFIEWREGETTAPPKKRRRSPRGETPTWFADALLHLKDGLSDREISRRIGVAPSTMCGCTAWQKAKQTYAPADMRPTKFEKRGGVLRPLPER